MKPLLPLLALLLALAACSGSDGGSPVSPDTPAHGLEPLPEGPWTDLARRLVMAEDLTTATKITREVLARGGMATTDGERIVVKAIGPATPYAMTALEARNLAMEARNRETAFRLHASEFANFLNTFGWGRGGSADDPAWLTEKEARALYDEALDRADTADDARLAADKAEELAAQQRVEELEAIGAKLMADYKADKARVDALPLAQREPMRAQLEVAYKTARTAQFAASDARRDARSAAREHGHRASHARERAHREFWAWQQVGPNYHAGDTLLRMLDTWVRAAAENPDDPQSFTPLFLAEMARLQQAPFDLLGSEYMRPARGTDLEVDLRGGPRSDDYRMTLLEMQLFLAAFQRGQPAAPTAMRAVSPPSRIAASIANVLLPPAHAQGSLSGCDDIKKILGGDSPGESSAVGWAVNETGNTAFKALGELYGISEAALSKLGNASKLLRVVIQFANTEAKVEAEQGTVHKPRSGSNDGHGTRYAWFTASAGVDPEDLEAYERSLQDQEARTGEIINRCFGSLELPSLQSMKEIADAAENWRVQWELRPLFPAHMNIPMRDPDNAFINPNSARREMQLRRASPAHAEARLKTYVEPEQASRGEVTIAHHTVVAKVVDTGAPGFGEMVNAVKGIFGMGMTDIVVDMAAGWMKHILVPRAAALQPVEYHCLDKQYIRRVSNPVADGETQPRTRDHCVVAAEAGEE